MEYSSCSFHEQLNKIKIIEKEKGRREGSLKIIIVKTKNCKDFFLQD